MRILVCGGRDFGYIVENACKKKDFVLLNKAMDFVMSYKPTTIIQGKAKGGDEIGGFVAEALKLEHLIFPADWDKYGKGAGHIRNQQMLDEGKPDLVIAFEGGRGTANMIQRSKKAGVKVIEVTKDDL